MTPRLHFVPLQKQVVHAGLVHGGPPPRTPQCLLHAADVVLHWHTDVLGAAAPAAAPAAEDGAAAAGAGVDPWAEDDGLAILALEDLDLASLSADGSFDLLLSLVQECTVPAGPGLPGAPSQGWAAQGKVTSRYYAKIGVADRERFKALLEAACGAEPPLVACGRRRVATNAVEAVPFHAGGAAGMKDEFHPEAYLRATAAAEALLARPGPPASPE